MKLPVFVYGTLKSGYGNNRLLQGCTKLCDAYVIGHKLFDSGFPVASPSDDNHSIKGEVWDIEDSNSVLASLDRLEGVPRMYLREEVVAIADDGYAHLCYMYVGNPRCFDFDKMNLCTVTELGGDSIHSWSR